MAAKRRVIFIEEPVHDEAAPHWELSRPTQNVLVCRPHTPIAEETFSDEQMPVLSTMLRKLIQSEHINGNAVVWLYTPMALPLARMFEPLAVVYDCMDQLAAFRFAPPQLLDREAELIEWADVVFTGGPSLYRSKKDRHPNVHCFASSVDAAHFSQARHIEEPKDQAPIPHPRFGYYGVIDERLDPELIAAIADAHPEWQVVMVGPVVKIDPATLPQRSNIHYMGQRTYDQLPAYLGGWDVCIMPFARNESTEYISPTKTLEYMAAELPIVSTPITDVAEPYGHIVYLGRTQAAFVAACEAALAAPESERQARVAQMRSVLAHTSWDSTASSMESLIDRAIENKLARVPKVNPTAVQPVLRQAS